MKVLLWLISVFGRILNAVKKRLLVKVEASEICPQILDKEGDTMLIKITCRKDKLASVYQFAKDHGYSTSHFYKDRDHVVFILWK